MNKKWKIFVTHNSHLDYGYTHRPEWIERAHYNFLKRVLELCNNDSEFRWTIETFWMYENFKKFSTKDELSALNTFIKDGQIEISLNYMNLCNLIDNKLIEKKAKKAKEIAKKSTFAIFQDINSISEGYAEALANAGTKYILGNINTFQGMYPGDGKQKPFIWELGNKKEVIVWPGEYYMMGAEFGLWGGALRDFVTSNKGYSESDDILEDGARKLMDYLKMLDSCDYNFDSLILPVSGTLLDNAAPSNKILDSIRKIRKYLPENVSIKMGSTQEFFDEIKKEVKDSNISIPKYKGEWTNWWDDVSITLPEEVRILRETQRLLNVIRQWNLKNKMISEEEIEEVEENLALFTEHTWGQMSNISFPCSNDNNLFAARKRGTVDAASKKAYELLDFIKQVEGENFLHNDWSDEVQVINPLNHNVDTVLPIQFNQFYDTLYYTNSDGKRIDNFKIFKKGSSQPLDSHTGITLNGMDNPLYYPAMGSDIIYTKISLKPYEKTTLKITRGEKRNDGVGTKLNNFVGAMKTIDIASSKAQDSIVFGGNYIQNKFYRIDWEIGKGITRIIDLQKNKNVLIDGKTLDIIYEESSWVQKENIGRNRRGPDAIKHNSQLLSVEKLHHNDHSITIKFNYKLKGTQNPSIVLRLSNIVKDIALNLLFQKDLVNKRENIYLNTCFVGKDNLYIHTQNNKIRAWKDHIPNSCIDFAYVDGGVSFEDKDISVGLSMYDNPFINLGPTKFEDRHLMNKKLDFETMEPMVWIMTMYCGPGSYAANLHGNYSFQFKITSSDSSGVVDKFIENNKDIMIMFPVYPKQKD